jgi:(2R)-3-sulfolactate dehydrogenase (NADP+)
MPILTLAEIERRAAEALIRAGASDAAARSVARSIRRAEADGIPLVGLGYLPIYLQNLREGKVDGAATPRLVSIEGGVVRVDAAHGFAHPALDLGLPLLADRAEGFGVASLGVTRSYSAGVLGHVVEDLADRGLLALAICNSPPNVAAWGGRRAMFGTNPIAFAAPRRAGPPLVIDQATSVVTKVALTRRAKAGLPLEPGWAFDRHGAPTQDAAAALDGGTLPAIGGAKGANLSLIVDLLAAGLTGANFSKDAAPYGKPGGGPAGVGQLVIAFAPDRFAPGFVERAEGLFAAILAEDGVRLPGDRRLLARARAAREGVAVEGEALAALGG